MAIQHCQGLPEAVSQYLEAPGRLYRRRTVLARVNQEWQLLCCTVEAFAQPPQMERFRSQHYPQCQLLEDWLEPQTCLRFAQQLDGGVARFEGLEVGQPRDQSTTWGLERLPVDNGQMVKPGIAASVRVGHGGTIGHLGILLAPDSAYYPDLEQAARSWLALENYSGFTDGRNYQVIFLLPEMRAYFESTQIDDEGILWLKVAGEQPHLAKRVMGAYWIDRDIHHFDTPVKDFKAHVAVPANAQRLDFFLVDREGAPFDFHQEDRRYPNIPGRKLLAQRGLPREREVLNAIEGGEDVHKEFKPFVDPAERLFGAQGKTKLAEVVISVVAFANREGGTVYLGIDDDCTLRGVQPALERWGEARFTEELMQRYLAVLRARVRDAIDGVVDLALESVKVHDAVVVLIQVSKARQMPVCVKDDRYLYVRTSATNRRVPPTEWRTVLGESSPPFGGWPALTDPSY